MTRAPKLSEDEVQRHVLSVPGWQVVDGRLHRRYEFADFVHAFGFMATAAIAIEKMNHHPEWTNVYNRVTVDLVTHDAQGLTALDFQLAALLDSLAQKLQ